MKPTDPNLQVRFASDEADLSAVQRLRYRVFVSELGAHASEEEHSLAREIDAFDRDTLHLCLIDKEREKRDPEHAVVGVYRLITEEAAAKIGAFYSASEYDLKNVLATPGKKLELGRSCIDPDYRGGAAMAMLWSALGGYVEDNNIETLFGTASFHGTGLEGKRQGLSLLYHHYLAPETERAYVLPENGLDMNIFAKDQIDRLYAMRDIPSLIKAYLRLGGVIGQGAYIDRDFNTIDVFVLMHTKNMVEKYKAMYRR